MKDIKVIEKLKKIVKENKIVRDGLWALALVAYLVLIVVCWNVKNKKQEVDITKVTVNEETFQAEEKTSDSTVDKVDIIPEVDNWKQISAAGLDAFYNEDDEDIKALYDILSKVNDVNIILEEKEEEPGEYSDFAIADVINYVNVRSEPSTNSEVVAKMYDGAVAQIQNTVECEDGTWLEVISGNATGYIKAEYFIYGDAAEEVIEDYVDRYVQVNCDRLNIREEADIDSKRIGYAVSGEKLKMVEDLGDWKKVIYAKNKTGYVFSEYVAVKEEFIYARTIEEEKKILEEQAALLARQQEDEQTTPENVTMTQQAPPASTATYTASGNLRSDICNFALQYVGHPYVHGGNSLETGTDCSGFTSLVYAQFGVGLSRTPGGQLSSNGRSVPLDQAQPGDIVCYGKSRCTHVGIYIGNGQIVHAANPRKGIVVYNVGYDNILGVKNVLD